MNLSGIFSAGKSGHNKTGKFVRKPFAAGRFYTDDPGSLRAELDRFFRKAMPAVAGTTRAVIVPHAGYAYSGQVAASGFNQIDPEAEFENIFIIASSHRMSFEGASVYYRGNYVTPLGEVEVNHELAKQLHEHKKVFAFEESAHLEEHSLEVQLPFLQYHLKKPFRIVPVIIGVRAQQDCRAIAEGLEPYFNENNLFIISTDFSHYPSYDNARKVDEATADAILKNDVGTLKTTLLNNNEQNIPELATSLCGWSSVYTLLYLTKGKTELKFRKIQYMNSGDQAFGDKNNVVGYHAIVVYEEEHKSRFLLDSSEKKKLLEIARDAIANYLETGHTSEIDTTGLSISLLRRGGSFVSLHKGKELRGCIGRFNAPAPLYQVVQEMAIAAATTDSRFKAVEKSELKDIDIEISVLSPLQLIKSIDEIEMGKHGIYIRKNNHSGTYLPQVSVRTGWSREEFLGYCAKDKAGIDWEGWKDAEIYTYEAVVFSESEHY